MTILGFSFDPLSALVAFNISLGWIAAIIGYLFGVLVWSKYPESEEESEEEPAIDFEALEVELQMERAILEYRLAEERRAEMIARAS